MIKKINALYLICVTFLLGFSCHNEPYEGDILTEDNSCLLAIEAATEASENFANATEDNYSLLCQVYRDALEDVIEICGDDDGSLQLLIDELGSCASSEDLCAEAEAATEIARADYESALASNFTTLCIIYRSALQYQIEVCGDPFGSLQLIVSDLGDCQPVFEDTEGTWKLTSWLNDQGIDVDNDGEVTFDYLEEIDCYNNETITFNGDGTGVFFYRSEAEITYTPVGADGEDFFVDCNPISINVPFTWIQNGNNTVIITFGDGTTTNYFRNADSLFKVIVGGFTATNTENANETIVEPVTYVYVKE